MSQILHNIKASDVTSRQLISRFNGSFPGVVQEVYEELVSDLESREAKALTYDQAFWSARRAIAAKNSDPSYPPNATGSSASVPAVSELTDGTSGLQRPDLSNEGR